MRILFADDNDAKLSAAAIYRLGSLVAAQANQGVPTSLLRSDLDRRYEQLVECIELRIKSIKVADLSRYLWAATTLRAIDEPQATLAFNEYIRRLKSTNENLNCEISVEEAAAILWAVGCLKDSFGWTSMELVSLLCEILDDIGAMPSLSTKLIVRVLWSLALHDTYNIDICSEGLLAIDNRGLQNMPGTNAINLLWSQSQLKDLFNIGLLKRLLERVLTVFENQGMAVAITDTGLASDALLALHKSVQEILVVALSQSCIDAFEVETLQAILNLIKKNIHVLVDCFVCNRITSNPLSLTILISVMRAAAAAEKTTSEIWDFSLSYFEFNFNESASITAVEAAAILEVVTLIPKKLPSLNDDKIFTSQRSNGFTASLSAEDMSSDALMYSSSSSTQRHDAEGTRDIRWHAIAGRLSAICATDAVLAKDKTCLINACWAIATLGYPYRKLLTSVRKSIQFALHELSPNLLAKLVVAVAAEECLTGPSVIAGASPKLDREFVDQVALSVYHNLADMTPLQNQISAMVAAACLGRLTSFEMRFTSEPKGIGKNPDRDRDRQKSVIIELDRLQCLSTSVLIKLFWAIHRLPDGVVASNTMKLVHNEIGTRNLYPSAAERTAGISVTQEMVTKDDLKLLARVFSEANILSMPDNKVEETACHALLHQLKLTSHLELQEEAIQIVSESKLAADAASLCDVLHSFIDLKWQTAEAVPCLQTHGILLSEKLKSLNLSSWKSGDGLNACAYHVGRFEELLKIYKNLPAIGGGGRYHIGKQLSRWLGL
jgi:hypothetical protein